MLVRHKSYKCGSARTVREAVYKTTRVKLKSFSALAALAGKQGLEQIGMTVRVKRNDRVFKRVGFCSRGKEPLFREVLR